MRVPGLRLFADEIIVDNFAGGGGASLGIELGLGRSPDVAINHDPEAIAMHKANHPATRHYCEDVWKVDPIKACGGRPVGLAWFSPDCKHFSKAKGGKPVDKKIRGLAWIVVRWAKAVRPRVICLENVEEFEDWGPLLENGKPCPNRKGLTFRIWKGKLEALGYKVEYRELVAADYGTPTTRKRLFLVARRDGLPIVWPTATHGAGRSLPWRTAAECIDWSLPTYSIFLTREEARPYKIVRPLAENTMRRIARGLKKFVIDNPKPFIVPYYGLKANETRAHSVDEPLKTQTGDPTFSLVDPFMVPVLHGDEPRAWPLDEPMRTITGATRGDRALVAPYVTRIGQTGGNGDYSRSPEQPISTITSKAEHLVVSPYLAGVGGRKGQSPETPVDRPYHTITAKGDTVLVSPTMITTGYGERPGQDPRAPGLHKPLGTVVGGGQKHALVSAFLAKHYGCHETPGSALSAAMDTVTAKDHHALVASSIVKLKGTCEHGQQMELPMPTVQSEGNHLFESRAFLLKYYGPDQDPRLEEPLHTVTSHDRHGLVLVSGEPYVIADIGMRMLAPRELYRAQGFPDSYLIDLVIDGRRLPKDAQVRMVGNSVCPPLAAAIARAQFEEQQINVAA